MPIYILDEENTKEYKIGDASKAWLHHSLIFLNKSLDNNLFFYKGNPIQILLELISYYKIKKIFWNRCYEPHSIKRDKYIKSKLQDIGVSLNTYNGSLLWEPWNVKKEYRTPYKIFTHFYRKGCLNSLSPRGVIPKPDKINIFKRQMFLGYHHIYIWANYHLIKSSILL